MFRIVDNSEPEIEIFLDQEKIRVPAGITLAAALLLRDRIPTRHNPVDRSPRAPHCLIGACFECLLEIDGVEQRACQVEVRQGMRIKFNTGDRTK